MDSRGDERFGDSLFARFDGEAHTPNRARNSPGASSSSSSSSSESSPVSHSQDPPMGHTRTGHSTDTVTRGAQTYHSTDTVPRGPRTVHEPDHVPRRARHSSSRFNFDHTSVSSSHALQPQPPSVATSSVLHSHNAPYFQTAALHVPPQSFQNNTHTRMTQASPHSPSSFGSAVSMPQSTSPPRIPPISKLAVSTISHLNDLIAYGQQCLQMRGAGMSLPPNERAPQFPLLSARASINNSTPHAQPIHATDAPHAQPMHATDAPHAQPIYATDAPHAQPMRATDGPHAHPQPMRAPTEETSEASRRRLRNMSDDEFQASLDALCNWGSSCNKPSRTFDFHIAGSIPFTRGELSSSTSTSTRTLTTPGLSRQQKRPDSEIGINIDYSRTYSSPSSTLLSLPSSPAPTLSSTPSSPLPPLSSSSSSTLASSSSRGSDSTLPLARTPGERATPRKRSRPVDLAIDCDDSDVDDVPLILTCSPPKSHIPRKLRQPRSAPAKSALPSKNAQTPSTQANRSMIATDEPATGSAPTDSPPLPLPPSSAESSRILKQRQPFVAPAPGSMPKRPKKRIRKGRIIKYTPKNGVKARRYPRDHAPTRRWDVLETTQFWMLFYPLRTTIGWKRNWRVIAHLLRRTKEQAKSHGQKMFNQWAKHPVLREFIPPKANEHESVFPSRKLMPAARVFGRHDEQELSMDSEPLMPANHDTMDEDTKEAMALWWANGIELPKIKRGIPTPPHSAPLPRAKKSHASDSSTVASAARSDASLSFAAPASAPKKRKGASAKKRKGAVAGALNLQAAKNDMAATGAISLQAAKKCKGAAPKKRKGAAEKKRMFATPDAFSSQAAEKGRTPKESTAARDLSRGATPPSKKRKAAADPFRAQTTKKRRTRENVDSTLSFTSASRLTTKKRVMNTMEEQAAKELYPPKKRRTSKDDGTTLDTSLAATPEGEQQDVLSPSDSNSENWSSIERSSVMRRLPFDADSPALRGGERHAQVQSSRSTQEGAHHAAMSSFSYSPRNPQFLPRGGVGRGKNHLLRFEDNDLTTSPRPAAASSQPTFAHQQPSDGLRMIIQTNDRGISPPYGNQPHDHGKWPSRSRGKSPPSGRLRGRGKSPLHGLGKSPPSGRGEFPPRGRGKSPLRGRGRSPLRCTEDPFPDSDSNDSDCSCSDSCDCDMS